MPWSLHCASLLLPVPVSPSPSYSPLLSLGSLFPPFSPVISGKRFVLGGTLCVLGGELMMRAGEFHPVFSVRQFSGHFLELANLLVVAVLGADGAYIGSSRGPAGWGPP